MPSLERSPETGHKVHSADFVPLGWLRPVCTCAGTGGPTGHNLLGTTRAIVPDEETTLECGDLRAVRLRGSHNR